MPTKEKNNIVFGVSSANGEFVQLGRITDLPELSQDEPIETTEIPDLPKKTYELEVSFEPPKNHRELKHFIEMFNPGLNYIIWWEQRYGCNNWRKMHGFPMERRVKGARRHETV